MTARFCPSLLHVTTVALLATVTPLAVSQKSPRPASVPFQIEVQDGHGVHIAGASAAANSPKVELTVDRIYQPGDRILFNGPTQLAVKLDDTMPDCLVFLPDDAATSLSFEVPYGRGEQQTGSAYAPEAFTSASHRITLRRLTPTERTGYRNLAINPCDIRQTEPITAHIFPHATSNSASRNAFDFEARNAIDGNSRNGHHGEWPFESWGPELRNDLWWKVDFGRPVELDKLRIMVRADFPHDSYWKTATLEFSDGTSLPIQLNDSSGFQDFAFPKRRVSWVRVTDLVSAVPGKWCSFLEVEAWGHDLL